MRATAMAIPVAAFGAAFLLGASHGPATSATLGATVAPSDTVTILRPAPVPAPAPLRPRG